MCYSTEASFTAAFLLGLAGGTTLKICSRRSQLLLAVIPLLFAMQQLSEGFIWQHFSQGNHSQFIFLTAERVYLFFAFFIWPIWIPLSVAAVEEIPWRRNLIYLTLAAGIILSLVNFTYAVQQDISVEVIHQSLHYRGQIPSQMLLYPFIILFPLLLSSFKRMWVFGVLIALGYVTATYQYEENFVSLWCFFAAIVSISIYMILKVNLSTPSKV